MATATLLLGLAGSGKSHRAEEISRATGAKKFEGVAASDKQELLGEMLEHLRSGGDCVVEEIVFCDATRRDQIVALIAAHAPLTRIEWVCFENDLDSANWNVRYRHNKGDVPGHLSINRYWTTRYTYPAGAVPVPIFRIPDPRS